MNRLSAIQVSLREISEGIARFERALAANPTSDSLLLGLRSLEKYKDKYAREFAIVAADFGTDICRYRMFRENRRESLTSALAVCIEFQRLYSLVYKALKTGQPVGSAQVGDEIAKETELGLAYSFNGSIGFALTLPNETVIVEPRVDQAMRLVFEMVGATEQAAVAEYKRKLGQAPMRALYDWSSLHADNELGADISWHRRTESKAHVLLDDVHLGKLAKLLTQRMPPEEETFEVPLCTLTAINTTRRTFSLTIPYIPPISGALHAAVDRDHTVEVPADYSATLKRITERSLGAENDSETYLLLRLGPRR